MQSGLPYHSGQISWLHWTAGRQESKSVEQYVGHGDFKYETSKDELKVTTAAKFEDRDATLTFV